MSVKQYISSSWIGHNLKSILDSKDNSHVWGCETLNENNSKEENSCYLKLSVWVGWVWGDRTGWLQVSIFYSGCGLWVMYW